MVHGRDHGRKEMAGARESGNGFFGGRVQSHGLRGCGLRLGNRGAGGGESGNGRFVGGCAGGLDGGSVGSGSGVGGSVAFLELLEGGRASCRELPVVRDGECGGARVS